MKISDVCSIRETILEICKHRQGESPLEFLLTGLETESFADNITVQGVCHILKFESCRPRATLLRHIWIRLTCGGGEREFKHPGPTGIIKTTSQLRAQENLTTRRVGSGTFHVGSEAGGECHGFS